MLHVVLWIKTRKNRYALIAMMAFFLQIFLHPGVAVAGSLFMGVLLLYSIKSSFISLIVSFSLNVRQFLVIVSSLLFGSILFIYLSTTSLIDLVGYSGWLTVDKVDGLVDRASTMQTGAASYPSWIVADSPLQFLLLLIPKLFYFLFSPFPWDISKFSHILGLLDGMVFIMLFFSIYSHRKYIKSNPQALILLVFVVFLSLIFSIAVGNFGTGLRHRSKILPIFIVIVAPFIYRLLFFNKKN